MTDPVQPLTSLTAPPDLQPYRSYLPTAFSDDLTLLQKVNMILNYLNTVTTTVNSAVDTVNGFASTIDTDVVNQLTTWKDDGTLDSLINQDILNNVQPKVNSVLYLSDYCKGDGVTDDSTAFNQALTDAITNGGQILLGDTGKTYKLNSGLTLDARYHKIDLRDSTLDFSGVTIGACITITSTQADTNQSPKQIKNYLKNGVILGSKTNGVTALNIQSASDYVDLFGFEKLYFTTFDTIVYFYTHAWANRFNECVFTDFNLALSIPSGGSNYGERFNFTNCYFFNGTNVADFEWTGYTAYFVNCSFDYCYQYFKVRGGSVRLTDCYFESDKDGSYWFDVDNGNSSLTLMNCDLYVAASRSTALGNVGSADGTGGIELTNVKYWIGVPYTADSLFTGTGRVKVDNVVGMQNTTQVIVANAINGVNNNSFAGASLSEFTLGGATLPVIDSSTGHTDSYSLKMAADVSTASTFLAKIPCRPGQQPRYRLWYKANGFTSSFPWYITGSFLDHAGSTISSFESVAMSDNPSSFTKRIMQANVSAPKGTESISLYLNNSGGAAKTVWIDDLHIEAT